MTLTTDKALEIRAGLDFGATNAMIATATDVGEATVARLRRLEGIPPVRSEDLERVIERELEANFRRGLSVPEAVEAYPELSPSTVLKIGRKVDPKLAATPQVSDYLRAEIVEKVDHGRSTEDILKNFRGRADEVGSVIRHRQGVIAAKNIKQATRQQHKETMQKKIIAAFGDNAYVKEVFTYDNADGVLEKKKAMSFEEIVGLWDRADKDDKRTIRALAAQHDVVLDFTNNYTNDQLIARHKQRKSVTDHLEKSGATYEAMSERYGLAIEYVKEIAKLEMAQLPSKDPIAEDEKKVVLLKMYRLAGAFDLSVAAVGRVASDPKAAEKHPEVAVGLRRIAGTHAAGMGRLAYIALKETGEMDSAKDRISRATERQKATAFRPAHATDWWAGRDLGLG